MSFPIIDVHEFLDLEFVDRQLLLEHHGVRLGIVHTAFKRMELYAIGSFYVERIVSLSNVFRCEDVLVPFVKGPRLDKYLDAVNLSDLFND